MATIAQTSLGQGLRCGRQGFGCMSLSPGFYGAVAPCPEPQAIASIHAALDNGASLLSTADFYGDGLNEELIGKALKGRPRESFQIASKWGPIFKPGAPPAFDASKEAGRKRIDASLKRLGVDFLDVWVLRLGGKPTELEDSVAVMAEAVKAGKVKYLGVSEMSAKDIRRAHAVHPITLCELELNLFSRDAEADLIPTCRELGIGMIAYSPMGRGLLTGTFDPKTLVKGDFRDSDMTASTYYGRHFLEQNLKLVEKVKELAAAKGCTAGQLALAWVAAQGGPKGDIVPIPGTKSPKYVVSNIEGARIKLTDKDLQDLEAAVPKGSHAGERYPGGHGTHDYEEH